jgi:Nucleotidyl transferase AbiEii toxin, Type IV TA system
MNPSFKRVLAATPADRRGLFVEAARRLGTTERYVEKDFWVCWTLDALFNGRSRAGDPRLLFKGGTSLSKAFGLIARFSEDIDITVFREDLGQPASCQDLEALSGKKRSARLDAIRAACGSFIAGKLLVELRALLATALEDARLLPASGHVELDPEDPDGQTLLLAYPSAVADQDAYVMPVVRVECGAKSALDPHASAIVRPYVANDLPNLDLAVPNVTTVDARRTFWDKVVILHGTRRWFDAKGELRQQGDRVSRHYYDVHRLLDSEVGRAAVVDLGMANDCARHARMFFDRPALDLGSAVAGRFAVAPASDMIEPLRRDYEKMAGMIFGTVPGFDEVLASVVGLDRRLNG